MAARAATLSYRASGVWALGHWLAHVALLAWAPGVAWMGSWERRVEVRGAVCYIGAFAERQHAGRASKSLCLAAF